jgi:pimeloyl-ACP methyl ester carboxylesterase
MRGHLLTAYLAVIIPCLAIGWTALAEPAAQKLPVNGAELAYVTEGEGAPVVFVHGAIADYRIWDGYRPQVADDHRFVAYSQRYFGTGPWPDKGEGFSVETHARDLIEFIEKLGAGPVHLVTWSYGGEVGVMAARERPDLFRSMVHFEPGIGSLLNEIPGGWAAVQDMNQAFGPAIRALKAGDAKAAAMGFIEAVFRLPEGAARQEDERWQQIWIDNARTVPPYMAMKRQKPVQCADLEKMAIPTLIVVGKNTYARYAMIAEKAADCLPNSDIKIMENVNHDGPMRKLQEFGGLVEDFIASVK